jgi:hypothetical protein
MEKQSGYISVTSSPSAFAELSIGEARTIPRGAHLGKCEENIILEAHEKSDERLRIEGMEKDANVEVTFPISKSVQDHATQGQVQAPKFRSPETSTHPNEPSGKQRRENDSSGSSALSNPATLPRVWKYIYRSSGRLTNVFFATVIYAVTTYCAMAASRLHSPLRWVSPTHGVLVFHILAKISDIGLGLAVASMWESVQWSAVFSGLGLSVPEFFALNSATGFRGLACLLISKTRIGHASRLWSLARYLSIHYYNLNRQLT